jgi:hypothetical protein
MQACLSEFGDVPLAHVLHECCPTASLYLPSSQGTQLVDSLANAPALDLFPAGQAAQPLGPLPGGALPAVATVPSEYFPKSHLAQMVPGPPEPQPAGQGTHLT